MLAFFLSGGILTRDSWRRYTVLIVVTIITINISVTITTIVAIITTIVTVWSSTASPGTADTPTPGRSCSTLPQ